MLSDPQEALILKIAGKVTGQSVLFMKLEFLYPECRVLIHDSPKLYPLRCLKDDGCPKNSNCMEKLAKRIDHIFDTFGDARILFLYFKYPDKPDSHRAGVFWKDNRPPKHITFNRSVWEKLKEIGVVYKWKLPNSLFEVLPEQRHPQSLLMTP